MTHYFIDIERKPEDYFSFKENFLDENLIFNSCNNVFSKNEIDYGTKVLLKTIVENADLNGKCCLDFGCGYGAIAITLCKKFKTAKFLMSDITNTACALSEENLELNNIKNAKVINSNVFENITEDFDYIISNPPIKTGKDILYSFVDNSKCHLNAGGALILVIKKKFGEDSLKKHLTQIFGNCEVLKRDSGYYILKSVNYV